MMILWLNDQHLYDADHAVTPQPSASFTKGFTNYVPEPKSIIMTWLLRVMGKRKIRIILNKCCNKTFCLSKYSEYPVGPAGMQGLINELRFTSMRAENLQSHSKGAGAGHRAHRCGSQPPKNAMATFSRGSQLFGECETLIHSVTLLNGVDRTQNFALV